MRPMKVAKSRRVISQLSRVKTRKTVQKENAKECPGAGTGRGDRPVG